jgi:hypothetical protein
MAKWELAGEDIRMGQLEFKDVRLFFPAYHSFCPLEIVLTSA